MLGSFVMAAMEMDREGSVGRAITDLLWDVGVALLMLAPLIAAVVDGRRRAASAMVVSAAICAVLIEWLGELARSPDDSPEMEQFARGIVQAILLIAVAVYTGWVGLVFGVAWLVRRVRAQDGPAV